MLRRKQELSCSDFLVAYIPAELILSFSTNTRWNRLFGKSIAGVNHVQYIVPKITDKIIDLQYFQNGRNKF